MTLFHFLLFAQNQPTAPAPAAPDDPNFVIRTWGMLAILLVLAYFMLIRPQQRKQKELQDTVGGLKENDRVVTIGGIHGVVTNVQRDLERVTIRVDESNGTKIKFNMSAIARVLTAEEKEAGSTGTKS